MAIVGVEAYGLVSLWAIPSLPDRIVGLVIGGTILFVVFRGGVRPAVVVDDTGVVVRNPLVDHIFTGAVGIELKDGQSPLVTQGTVRVPALAFSGSLIDQLTGYKPQRRLQADISHRTWEVTHAGNYRADRLGVLKQFGFAVAFSVVAAVAGELPFLAHVFR
ncbi:hypothetical protein Q6348_01380 [Isoptericola sp. b441]|uniref:Uncharacterized protein n=1 Tax=Actinotalea lenta TaxID=3064654 RepID=A0ABT9D680_9CELL|nr:hypothetical protein [Isoptericola sp. b441]MDO8105846.1 hypothetical protein [Isoptericola sp. b441]